MLELPNLRGNSVIKGLVYIKNEKLKPEFPLYLKKNNTMYVLLLFISITRIKAHCCSHTMGSSPYLLD